MKSDQIIFAAEMSDDCPKIDLHGLSEENVKHELDYFIDKAFREGWEVVKIIHGRGFGVLAKVAKCYLKGHDFIKEVKPSSRGDEVGGVLYAIVEKMK